MPHQPYPVAGRDEELRLALEDLQLDRWLSTQMLLGSTRTWALLTTRSQVLATGAAHSDAIDFWQAEEPGDAYALMMQARVRSGLYLAQWIHTYSQVKEYLPYRRQYAIPGFVLRHVGNLTSRDICLWRLIAALAHCNGDRPAADAAHRAHETVRNHCWRRHALRLHLSQTSPVDHLLRTHSRHLHRLRSLNSTNTAKTAPTAIGPCLLESFAPREAGLITGSPRSEG